MIRGLAFLFALLLALPARAACDHERDLAMRAEGSDAAYARAVGAWGLCAEKAGTFGEAHRLVSRALEAAPPGTSAAAPWPALRAALRRLDDRVARVLVTFDGDLWVDGKPMVAVSGAVLAVDPGRHVFEQRGKVVAAKEVEARAGDLPSVDLRSTAPGKEPSKQAVSVPLAPRSSPGVSSPFAPALTPRGIAVGLTYGALGVSLAAGIAAGILETQRAAAAAGSPLDACLHGGDNCAKIRLAFDQSRGARNVAIGAGVVAVLAGGVAVTLHLTGNKADVTVGGSW